MFTEIEHDTTHEHARFVDDATGIAAYIVQDPDPMPPSDFAEELQDQCWDIYNNGDVWGVIITGPDQCHVDSLWSIYDSDYGWWRTDSYTYQTALGMFQDAVATMRDGGTYAI